MTPHFDANSGKARELICAISQKYLMFLLKSAPFAPHLNLLMRIRLRGDNHDSHKN